MGGPKGGQACLFGKLKLTEFVMELQLIFSQEDIHFLRTSLFLLSSLSRTHISTAIVWRLSLGGQLSCQLNYSLVPLCLSSSSSCSLFKCGFLPLPLSCRCFVHPSISPSTPSSAGSSALSQLVPACRQPPPPLSGALEITPSSPSAIVLGLVLFGLLDIAV